MIVECPHCSSKVDAKLIAEKEYPPGEGDPYKICFLECPVCSAAIVGGSELIFLLVNPRLCRGTQRV